MEEKRKTKSVGLSRAELESLARRVNRAELKRVAHRICAGVNAVKAIQRSMEENTEAAENWAEGLWFVCYTLQADCDKLQNLVEQMNGLETESNGQEEGGATQ